MISLSRTISVHTFAWFRNCLTKVVHSPRALSVTKPRAKVEVKQKLLNKLSLLTMVAFSGGFRGFSPCMAINPGGLGRWHRLSSQSGQVTLQHNPPAQNRRFTKKHWQKPNNHGDKLQKIETWKNITRTTLAPKLFLLLHSSFSFWCIHNLVLLEWGNITTEGLRI